MSYQEKKPVSSGAVIHTCYQTSHLGYLHFNVTVRLKEAYLCETREVWPPREYDGLHECSVTPHNPIPPSHGAITSQNQALIRWCYLIKTAQCVAYTLIMTNLEEGGGNVCEGGGKEGHRECVGILIRNCRGTWKVKIYLFCLLFSRAINGEM